MSDKEIWPPIRSSRRKTTVSRRAVRAAVRAVIAERMAKEQQAEREYVKRATGIGFVEFGSADEAQAAITGLKSKVGDRTLKVSEARPRKNDAPRAKRNSSSTK